MNDDIYFSIKDNTTSINLTVTDYKYDYDKEIDEYVKTNALECYYNYSDNDGFGSVESEVSLEDIVEFARLFSRLMNNEINEFIITSKLFICEITAQGEKHRIDFKISDGLGMEWITVVREGLSRLELEALANAVITWAKEFSIQSNS